MSKKSDSFYFENFTACAAKATEAAALLESIMKGFDERRLSEQLAAMHTIEHEADIIKHKMTSELAGAFITPLDREDIMRLSENIDNVTDSIEDVVIRLYMNNIRTMRSDAAEFAGVVVSCCRAVEKMLAELYNFRRSKTLPALLVEINRLEEDGDRLYISSMRALHAETDDPMKTIAWRDVYEYLEKCCDACEHVADIVEGVVIGNS